MVGGGGRSDVSIAVRAEVGTVPSNRTLWGMRSCLDCDLSTMRSHWRFLWGKGWGPICTSKNFLGDYVENRFKGCRWESRKTVWEAMTKSEREAILETWGWDRDGLQCYNIWKRPPRSVREDILNKFMSSLLKLSCQKQHWHSRHLLNLRWINRWANKLKTWGNNWWHQVLENMRSIIKSWGGTVPLGKESRFFPEWPPVLPAQDI